ncbi:uncharacterized protein LOC120355548 [Nilaparvata lugens]|uniref:uncharacterized protein LOC120355548 n=1 Tax=Nilaparvata lugens TaxID=108931 RepID=UPI00193D1A84|nr:uncharacterized protein LOC120355548 [Nilaparvata lugens]
MAADSKGTVFTLPASVIENEIVHNIDGRITAAIAPTERIWGDDSKLEIQKKVFNCKSKFHMGLQLQINHLPRNVTESEILELLQDFPVKNVKLIKGESTSSMAIVIFEHFEILEDWDCKRVFLLRGQNISVEPSLSKHVLCVARLPLDLSEKQFTLLTSAYGDIKWHFLMIDEKTGKSKGYGFVEYVTEESALQAKQMLENKIFGTFTLDCDWLDSKLVKFESLHSKCLYVDCLPKNFRNLSEFRKIFSTAVSPSYCQIGLKNLISEGWGLVEFSNSEDAEVAHSTLNGYNLRNQKIRISFCIPGAHAINLYNELLRKTESKVKTDQLLPNPSIHVTNQLFQNVYKDALYQESEVFATNLLKPLIDQNRAPKRIIEMSSNQSSGQEAANSINGLNDQDTKNGKVFYFSNTSTTLKRDVNRFKGLDLFQTRPIGLVDREIHLSNKSAGMQCATPKINIGIAESTAQCTTLNEKIFSQHPPPSAQCTTLNENIFSQHPPPSAQCTTLNENIFSQPPTPLPFPQNSMKTGAENSNSLAACHSRMRASLSPMVPVNLLTPPPDEIFCRAGSLSGSLHHNPPPFSIPLSSVPVMHPSQNLDQRFNMPPLLCFPPPWAPPTPPPLPGILPFYQPQPLFPYCGAPGIFSPQSQATNVTIPPPINSNHMPSIGEKRKFMPDAELYPNDEYVGQLSQNNNGNYADSIKHSKT